MFDFSVASACIHDFHVQKISLVHINKSPTPSAFPVNSTSLRHFSTINPRPPAAAPAATISLPPRRNVTTSRKSLSSRKPKFHDIPLNSTYAVTTKIDASPPPFCNFSSQLPQRPTLTDAEFRRHPLKACPEHIRNQKSRRSEIVDFSFASTLISSVFIVRFHNHAIHSLLFHSPPKLYLCACVLFRIALLFLSMLSAVAQSTPGLAVKFEQAGRLIGRSSPTLPCTSARTNQPHSS